MSKEPSIKQIVDAIVPRQTGRGDLIPILQKTQARLGWLPREAMAAIADKLGLQNSEVYSVATFYNQFRLTPPGRNQIKVCLGTACQIKGGRIILDSWKRELNLEEGVTSADREYSLERVACVGCCAMAPVSVVNNVIEAKVSPTRVKGILLDLELKKKKRNGEKKHK
ncbi:MAG: NAD(P)H-dependent oxidoreductase subunit E [Dehalococcoidia bacterium]